jgi:hypothetical protein
MGKLYGGSSKKLKIELPYDPSNSPPGMYPKAYKSGYNKGTYTLMFTAALFTTAKLGKQSRYPTTDE